MPANTKHVREEEDLKELKRGNQLENFDAP